MPLPELERLAAIGKCHERRNLAEYEGVFKIDDLLLDGLLGAAAELLAAVRRLPAPAVEGRVDESQPPAR